MRMHCKCYTGFRGPYCNLDIDECEKNPCQNNGTCINIFGYYECLCADGYAGLRCNYTVRTLIPPCIEPEFELHWNSGKYDLTQINTRFCIVEDWHDLIIHGGRPTYQSVNSEIQIEFIEINTWTVNATVKGVICNTLSLKNPVLIIHYQVHISRMKSLT